VTVALKNLSRGRSRLEAEAVRTRFARARGRSPRRVPTAPESLPTRSPSSARATRRRLRSSSKAQPASLRPKVVGSACTPWCVQSGASFGAARHGRRRLPARDRSRRGSAHPPHAPGGRGRCRRHRRTSGRSGTSGPRGRGPPSPRSTEGGCVVVEGRLELGDPLRRRRPGVVSKGAGGVGGDYPELGPGRRCGHSTSSQMRSLRSSDQILAMAGRE